MSGSIKRISIGSIDGSHIFDVYDCGRTVVNAWTEKVLKQHSCKNGYFRVWNTATDGKRRSFLVHRLVAMAHLEYRKDCESLDVNHIDGNKGNNSFSNLEWVTKSENTQHSLRNLEDKPGRPVKMKDRDNEIRAWFRNGITRKELAEHFGISRPRIGNIINGKRR